MDGRTPANTLPDDVIAAGELPARLRRGIDPATLVRVRLEPVLTENGLSPQEEEAVAQAAAETRQGRNLSAEFSDIDAALTYLRDPARHR